MNSINIALNILQDNHFKITKQRRYLLEYLVQKSDFYVALSQLDQQMRQVFPKMSHETVYRNIKEMQQLGIVETKMFASGLRVKFQCDFADQEHSHFICQNCGRVVEAPLPDFTAINEQLLNYQINTHHVELWGICASCQSTQLNH